MQSGRQATEVSGQVRIPHHSKKHFYNNDLDVAEGEGFEPSVQLCGLPVFINFFNVLGIERILIVAGSWTGLPGRRERHCDVTRGRAAP